MWCSCSFRANRLVLSASKRLLLITLTRLGHLLHLVVAVEAARGELVQAEDRLVGVLDEDVLAVLLASETHVGNSADNTPAVGQRQVHLVGEVARLPADDAEDDVLVVGLGVGARDETVENVLASGSIITKAMNEREGEKSTQAS